MDDLARLDRGVQAIEADAHAAHVPMHVVVQDRGRGVGAVDDAALEARVLEAVDGLSEAPGLHLEVPVAWHVGRGEVGEDAGALDAAMEVDRATELEDVAPVHADAGHSRIDCHMIAGNLAGGCRTLAQGEGEVRVIDRRHQVMVHDGLHRRDRRLRQNQDGLTDAGLPELDALGHGGDRELVGAGAPHHLRTPHGPMSVGVRLHDAHHLHAGCHLSFQLSCVRADRVQVNLDPGPPVLARSSQLCHGRSSLTILRRRNR